MRVAIGAVALLASAATLPSTALADEAGEMQMTLPSGRFLGQANVEINLSKELVGKPFSIAPDLYYGVNDALTIGLIHSARGATGMFGGVGSSLCLAGKAKGCAKVYDAVGLAGRYHLYQQAGITLAVDGGFFARSFDPFLLSLKLGAIGRWQAGAIAVDAAPSIFVGLTEREPGTLSTSGNKETILLPITATYAVTPMIAAAAQVGATVPTESAGDVWTLGASLGAQLHVIEAVTIDAAFSLPLLAGGSAIQTGADVRTMTLGVSYAR